LYGVAIRVLARAVGSSRCRKCRTLTICGCCQPAPASARFWHFENRSAVAQIQASGAGSCGAYRRRIELWRYYPAHRAGSPGTIPLCAFVSREDTAYALRARIPEAIADDRLQAKVGVVLTAEKSQVMLCSNPRHGARHQGDFIGEGNEEKLPP
jgi:hypothetical protein